jgi:predicted DNA binding CopG/RHH family protein
MKYDKEEKYILEALDNNKIILKAPSDTEINAIKKLANNTFKKDKRISIRLYEHDFNGIQEKALEMGIPYQTLISGIIHRYIEGDLKSKIG